MKKNTSGFTLMEVLVAMALFVILVGIGLGGFSNALHTQGEVRSLISVQDNASVALEQMAREIRTGYLFCNDPNTNNGTNDTCSKFGQCKSAPALVPGQGNVLTCAGTTTANENEPLIDFYNADGQEIDYEIQVTPQGSVLARSDSGPGGTFTPITSPDVQVKNLTFTIFGNVEGDHWPPRITISLGVVPNSTNPALTTDVLDLQTTVSARQIDCTTGSGTIKC